MNNEEQKSQENKSITLLEIQNLKDELAVKTKEALEYLVGWKRALADYQNMEKEVVRREDKMKEFSFQSFIKGLLPVVEHWDMAGNFIPEDQKKQDWVVGIIGIRRQMDVFLSGLGVKRIELLGKPYDPKYAETVGEEMVKDGVSGVVLRELCGAYEYNGQVLRHAKVIVAK
ncbi:MAG: molecular chaperone GrpE [Parcubacteria group bacterium Gr01-1014_18]|nr:MAG: molecular chaperone GrpE [Parcubacteria group bacterium Greene0416_36]TSC81557.1 MAG: molecular chaperone GrpE [Parcubacteria group bacterium Gr01-1014_18]TSC99632.1 MAG: molecular chaperone GrpE [Parcubacteria group bacterium Greene1014_20]TSD07083.1 MAG: molecular chaperone GrpE [Parcubacteria group bacterium Greene0714_2]